MFVSVFEKNTTQIQLEHKKKRLINSEVVVVTERFTHENISHFQSIGAVTLAVWCNKSSYASGKCSSKKAPPCSPAFWPAEVTIRPEVAGAPQLGCFRGSWKQARAGHSHVWGVWTTLPWS